MFTPLSSTQQFPEMERALLDKWYSTGIIDGYLRKNDSSDETFSFLDGPITANNPMGVHHAWGRTYKDLWQKFNNLLGKKQRFQSGFDCQGLWVEVEVEKELGLHSKKDIENLVPGDKKASVAKFVQLCKDRVYKFSKVQTEQSKRLGYFMDWDHSYFTMSDENNYMIWRFIHVCHENGWVYKGHESVPWCPRCQTAISQHEMLTEDYKEVVHESVFIEFPIVGKKGEYLLVWTTTPWTIPANIAVAVDNKIEYALVEGTTGNTYWIAKDLVEAVFNPSSHKTADGQAKGYKKIVKTALGKELVGLRYEGPFDHLPAVAEVKKNHKKFHTVVPTDALIMPISTTEGTGLVHTAVSAGTEDFLLGKKLGLPMIPVIADDASYLLDGFGDFGGKNAKKHPELIIDFLKAHRDGEFLFSTLRYKHRYPACWRCKAELVWKVADEWYIAMDVPAKSRKSKVESQVQDTRTLRERMIAVAKQITWIPGFGLERELDWLKNMHDWLISKKNRYWGLSLPIYECTACKTFEVMGSKEELHKRAVSGWEAFEGHSPHKPFIDEVTISCPNCKGEMHRIEDVGNPWLDAGIVAYSTISKNNTSPLYLENKTQWGQWFPADFITESFPGQFKNWFYSLIAMSTVMEDRPPFKTILGYATCMGEDGRAMHKSWGNYIEFNEGAEKIGVDVMRWMFARQNPADNLLFGYKKADEVRRQFYLMVWNVYKFFVDYATMEQKELQGKPNLSLGKANILDEWIMTRLSMYVAEAKKAYSSYNVQSVAQGGEALISDVSQWFIRRSRDRVWVNSDNETDKQSFYETLHSVLVVFAVTVSPIMPFITDEIYTNLTGEKSVHLAGWMDLEKPKNDEVIRTMTLLRSFAECGHRARKENKLKVRQPLASVTIRLAKDTVFVANEPLLEILKSELNVKKVIFASGDLQQHEVVFDTTITKELAQEGKMRDLVRSIQEQRKIKQVKPDQKIRLSIPSEFMPYKDYIAKRVLASEIVEGELEIGK